MRGKSVEAIMDANTKVDRALRACALAMGAQVEITTLPGYMPLANHPELAKIFRRNAEEIVGTERYVTQGHRTGATDMGDISQIMPAVQGYMSGASGTGHGADFMIADPRFASSADCRENAWSTWMALSKWRKQSRGSGRKNAGITRE